MTSIPSEAFTDILNELRRQPIANNKYRNKAGTGQSQTFGIVNRRCLSPDYSRQNWLRPFLYHLLLEFAEKYVTIPFNSITVNQNYAALPHRDKNNKGNSFLVAFGDYTGGELKIYEGDLSGNHNINCRPIRADFSKILHSVSPFQGERYSLVFYNFWTPRLPELPPYSVKEENGKFYFYRGQDKITAKTGLPHPLKGRKKKTELSFTREEKSVTISFM